SRDNTRVGASLKFDYELKEKKWHHRGLNSKGSPIYEIWSLR
ncbi:MAG: membrane or secreted protein, partial [Bacteroidetes bacterium]|nr:membrane or secreted protein [Bacteroidota bacterium]